jgi:hypothetical protein
MRHARAGAAAGPYEWLIWNCGRSGKANSDASRVRTSTRNRHARADTAVRPYTEDLFQ